MPLTQVDKQIEIAVWSRVTTGDGPEHPDRQGAVARGDALDLIAATTELFQIRRRAGRTRVRIQAATALDFTAELTEAAQRRVVPSGRVAHSLERKTWLKSRVDRPARCQSAVQRLAGS